MIQTKLDLQNIVNLFANNLQQSSNNKVINVTSLRDFVQDYMYHLDNSNKPCSHAWAHNLETVCQEANNCIQGDDPAEQNEAVQKLFIKAFKEYCGRSTEDTKSIVTYYIDNKQYVIEKKEVNIESLVQALNQPKQESHSFIIDEIIPAFVEYLKSKYVKSPQNPSVNRDDIKDFVTEYLTEKQYKINFRWAASDAAKQDPTLTEKLTELNSALAGNPLEGVILYPLFYQTINLALNHGSKFDIITNQYTKEESNPKYNEEGFLQQIKAALQPSTAIQTGNASVTEDDLQNIIKTLIEKIIALFKNFTIPKQEIIKNLFETSWSKSVTNNKNDQNNQKQKGLV